MVVGYLACSFDLLHVGHINVVAQALRRCEELVVGVLPDELVTDLCGRPPVVPLAERIALMSHVRGVRRAVVHTANRQNEVRADLVFVMEGDGPAGWSDGVVLVPERSTLSPTLLAALRPVIRQHAAR